MLKLKAGDRISCKLKESKIIAPNEDYDNIQTFEIISTDLNNEGYHLFIPHYLFVKDTKKIDNYNHRTLKISSKYIGDECIFISEKMIFKIAFVLEGTCCNRCQAFFDYVQPTSNNWLCWSCNKDPYR